MTQIFKIINNIAYFITFLFNLISSTILPMPHINMAAVNKYLPFKNIMPDTKNDIDINPHNHNEAV